MALMAFSRKNSDVNGLQLEKMRSQRRLTGKIKALRALNRKNCVVNGV